MKIVITGASGLLGKRLFEILSKTQEVTGTYFGNKKMDNLHYIDVSDKNDVESFFEKIRPEVIIHAAAMVDVDFCEEHKEDARKVNVEGTRNIVEICKKYNCKLVFLSSDYVFDGQSGPYTEESPTKTVNYYAKTKLEAEEIVKKNLNNYIVIRSAILYGDDEGSKNSFITNILKKLRNNENVSMDNKIVKYPTLTDDVVQAIKKLIELDAKGIFHVSGNEAVTRYQWALRIAKAYGLSTTNIAPNGSPGKAPRPVDIKLESAKIKKLGFKFLAETVDRGIDIVRCQKGCMFKMIYSARPDVLVLNQNTSVFRINIGKQLAKEHPIEADMVIPVPESGMYGATGYSSESKIPFYFGIIRDYYTNKTLFEPTLEMRIASLNKKLIIVPEVVKDKRVVIVDEAIVAGTTLEIIVKKLKQAGVKEIHIRIPCPPMLYQCKNGILKEDAKLIATPFADKKEDIEEGLKKHFGVDSLRFLGLDGFLGSLSPKCDVCVECFKQKDKIKHIKLNDVPDELREGGGYSIKRILTETLKKKPDNVGFYQTTIPAHSKVKNHYHQELDEFLYFVTPGKVRVNSDTYVLAPGDILALPPGSPHEIFAEEKEVKLIAIKLPNIINDKVNV